MAPTHFVLERISILIFEFEILEWTSIVVSLELGSVITLTSLLIFSRIAFKFFGSHVSVSIAVFGANNDLWQSWPLLADGTDV